MNQNQQPNKPQKQIQNQMQQQQKPNQMQQQIPNQMQQQQMQQHVSKEDYQLHTQREFIKVSKSQPAIIITDICTEKDQPIAIQYKYSEPHMPQVSKDLDLEKFIKLDHFTTVYLLRFCISNPTPENILLFQKIISIYPPEEIKTTMATKYLRGHFNKVPKLDFENFVALLNWIQTQGAGDDTSIFLTNPIYEAFKTQLNEISSEFVSKNLLKQGHEKKQLTDYLSCVLAASYTSYPFLMLNPQDISKILDLKLRFSFLESELDGKMIIQNQDYPKKWVGQNMVIMMKFSDEEQMKIHFKNFYPIKKDQMIEINFEQVKPLLTDDDGILFKEIIHMYSFLVESRMLNENERKIHLMFENEDQVYILLQSNQKTNNLLAHMLSMLLESLVSVDRKLVRHLKCQVFTFNSGMNQLYYKLDQDIPFKRESVILKQLMQTSFAMYDLSSQQSNEEKMKDLSDSFSLIREQKEISNPNEIPMTQWKMKPLSSHLVSKHENFMKILFENHLHRITCVFKKDQIQNPLYQIDQNGNQEPPELMNIEKYVEKLVNQVVSDDVDQNQVAQNQVAQIQIVQNQVDDAQNQVVQIQENDDSTQKEEEKSEDQVKTPKRNKRKSKQSVKSLEKQTQSLRDSNADEKPEKDDKNECQFTQ